MEEERAASFRRIKAEQLVHAVDKETRTREFSSEREPSSSIQRTEDSLFLGKHCCSPVFEEREITSKVICGFLCAAGASVDRPAEVIYVSTKSCNRFVEFARNFAVFS